MTRNYCDACERKSYDEVYGESPGIKPGLGRKLQGYLEDGWKHMSEHAGIVKQCAACAAKESA